MNILFIANIPPYEPGGAETQAKKIAIELIKLGHSVTIVGHRIPTGFEDVDGVILSTIKIPIINFNRVTRAISYVILLSFIFLKRLRYTDIVYCRFVQESAITISILKKILRIKIPLVACTACTGEYGDAKFLLSLPASKYMIKMINQGCNRINNISPATAKDLTGVGVNKVLMKYIPNGTQVPRIVKKHYSDLGNTRSLIYLGRLHKQKGLVYLFESIRNLLELNIHVHLTLIGDGEEREALEMLSKEYGIDHAVKFIGFVPNEKIMEYLMEHDIFVMSSLYEGFATVVIEAMSVGLPVIVTRCGGPEYFVDDTVGRVCEPADVQSLQHAINELINFSADQLATMGKNGRQRFIDKYTIESVALQYQDLFEECLADTNG